MAKLFYGELRQESEAVCVIMAGGSGTRFWPLSRSDRPKQFLDLAGSGKSLIQMTYDRLKSLPFEIDVLVATGEKYIELTREHLPGAAILAEPSAKNTAPCLAYAAALVEKVKGPTPLICLPADHVFSNVEALNKSLAEAKEYVAKNNALITIGIEPTHPETGYGYIEADDSSSGSGPLKVKRFVEKPDLETAESYLKSGSFLWNSGMFAWRSDYFKQSIAEHLPDLAKAMDSLEEVFFKEDEKEQICRIFEDIKSESIDFGLMEKAKNVFMYKGEGLGWCDIGAWDAWASYQDERGQNENGQTNESSNLLTVDSKDVSLYSESDKLVAVIGVDNLIVVETEDATLICPKNKAQQVREVIAQLKERKTQKLL